MTPPGDQTVTKKFWLVVNSEIFKGIKNMFGLWGIFFRVTHMFKPTVWNKWDVSRWTQKNQWECIEYGKFCLSNYCPKSRGPLFLSTGSMGLNKYLVLFLPIKKLAQQVLWNESCFFMFSGSGGHQTSFRLCPFIFLHWCSKNIKN